MPDFHPIPIDPRFQDLTGKPYGEFKVLGYAGKVKSAHYWWCECSCDNVRRVCGVNLKKENHSRSCGCLRKRVLSQLRTTHGASGHRQDGQQHRDRTPEYRSWTSMRNRCLNTKDRLYKDYGARGITICPEWDDFSVFLVDMGPRPPRTTLGRKDNDGPYASWNCEWQTSSQQSRNRRNARMLTFQGRTQNLAAWATEMSMIPETISSRIERGWSVENALTTPVRVRRS